MPHAASSARTRAGVAIPVVSASVSCVTPRSSNRRASAATSAGSVSPLYGEPKQHDTTASTGLPLAIGDDVGDRGLAVGDRHVHVLLVVCGVGGDRDGQRLDVRGNRQLGTAPVGHERPPRDVGLAVDRREHGVGIGHRRHRLGRHEADRLDVAHTGRCQCVDEPGSLGGGDGLLGLQTVARSDLPDRDVPDATRRIGTRQLIPVSRRCGVR